MIQSADIRQYDAATSLEAVFADVILDSLCRLENEVSEGFLTDADDLWEAAENGDAREIYRASMIFKTAVDEEKTLTYVERLKLNALAYAIIYAVVEKT